jgi:hypothetical protein
MDDVAQKLADTWRFKPTEELKQGYCSRVYANERLVLKVPFQGEEQFSGWQAALTLSSNIGPCIHQFDPDTGSLLMDRIRPGTMLMDSDLGEDRCRQIVLGFSREIATLDPVGLLPLRDYVSKNDALADRLLETTHHQVFLHGDLHHENILLGEHGWTVIDPKGLIGDPAFEPSAFIRNALPPLEGDDLETFLRLRIDAICRESGLNPWRVCGWAIVAVGSYDSDNWKRVERPLRRILEGCAGA